MYPLNPGLRGFRSFSSTSYLSRKPFCSIYRSQFGAHSRHAGFSSRRRTKNRPEFRVKKPMRMKARIAIVKGE
jgi:hypothetical protein